MKLQELFPKEVMLTLIANGEVSAAAIAKDGETPDHVPALKLFTPFAGCTWLLTEFHPDHCEGGAFYGLCDLGQGCPELGYVSKVEIEQTAFDRTRRGLPQAIERDEYFHTERPLSIFTDMASSAGRIVS